MSAEIASFNTSVAEEQAKADGLVPFLISNVPDTEGFINEFRGRLNGFSSSPVVASNFRLISEKPGMVYFYAPLSASGYIDVMRTSSKYPGMKIKQYPSAQDLAALNTAPIDPPSSDVPSPVIHAPVGKVIRCVVTFVQDNDFPTGEALKKRAAKLEEQLNILRDVRVKDIGPVTEANNFASYKGTGQVYFDVAQASKYAVTSLLAASDIRNQLGITDVSWIKERTLEEPKKAYAIR